MILLENLNYLTLKIMLMYDNVGFYLSADEVGSENLIDDVLQNGNDITIELLGENGYGTEYAYISLIGRNEQKLTFKVLPYQISLIGKNSSICKYYLGDNFQTLTLKQFNDAIDDIEERLNIDLSKAVVCRIDIAANFFMKYSPSSYHSCLTHLSRHIRGAINGNLYFKTTRKELNFYDKKKEYRQKRKKIPKDYEDIENVLRYEIRFRKNVKKQFGHTVTIADLCREDFFKRIVNKWQSNYWSITKQNPIVFEKETTTFSTSDFRDFFFVQGVEANGGIDYVYTTIDESKKADAITSSKASYLRKVVNNAYTNPNVTTTYDFVEELDEKMRLFEIPLL